MRVGIIGGTGPAGVALAARLASVGVPAAIGSRSSERAHQARDAVLARWGDLDIAASDNAGVAACDVVVMATPWDGAAETASALAGQLAGKVVVSMANALVKMGPEFTALVPARGSIAANVQAAAPQAHVVAALQHVPAKELGQIDQPVDSDVLVCSDHPQAKGQVMELLARIPNLRPLDAGRLSSAAPIEALTAVLVQMNARYKTRVALRLTGIPG